jgi:hypothetical protein
MNNVNYNIQLIQNGPQSILKLHIEIFYKKFYDHNNHQNKTKIEPPI